MKANKSTPTKTLISVEVVIAVTLRVELCCFVGGGVVDFLVLVIDVLLFSVVADFRLGVCDLVVGVNFSLARVIARVDDLLLVRALLLWCTVVTFCVVLIGTR